MGEEKILGDKEAALPVFTCITRNLEPAFNLEQELDVIKGAVEELKANPPVCSTEMYRFQIAVPPSAKALNWFCSYPDSSKVTKPGQRFYFLGCPNCFMPCEAAYGSEFTCFYCNQDFDSPKPMSRFEAELYDGTGCLNVFAEKT